MKPSKENPEYTVVITMATTGEQFELTPILISLELSHPKEQLAQCATLTLMNINHEGRWTNTMFRVRDRVFIYANDGERHEEVFRGFVWSHSYTSAVDQRELVLRCYDNLIYWQESEDSDFFPKGRTTKDVVQTLFDKWGIPLEYRYESITHDKLPLRGTLADLVTSDILDKVRKQTGVKYAVIMEGDTAVIRTLGDNESWYRVDTGSRAVHTKSDQTMEGMTTKVVILGKADDDKKAPVEAEVVGDTDKYGTLQKLQDRDEKTTLADAKKEAQSTLDENGEPKWEFELKCGDIPWVRRGDRINVSVGSIYESMMLILGIDRTLSDKEKTMTLTMEAVKK